MDVINYKNIRLLLEASRQQRELEAPVRANAPHEHLRGAEYFDGQESFNFQAIEIQHPEVQHPTHSTINHQDTNHVN